MKMSDQKTILTTEQKQTWLLYQIVSFPMGSMFSCVSTVINTSWDFSGEAANFWQASCPMKAVFLLGLMKGWSPASYGFLSRFIWKEIQECKWVILCYCNILAISSHYKHTNQFPNLNHKLPLKPRIITCYQMIWQLDKTSKIYILWLGTGLFNNGSSPFLCIFYVNIRSITFHGVKC